MTNLSKKDKETLFLIFLLGGITGSLDHYSIGVNINLGSFVGSGLAMILFALAIGLIAQLILPTPSNKQKECEGILDAPPQRKYRLDRIVLAIQYGKWISIFMLITFIINFLSS